MESGGRAAGITPPDVGKLIVNAGVSSFAQTVAVGEALEANSTQKGGRTSE
jgi:hypothetical protein